MFLQMNRNKKCLTLNPAGEKGREVIARLVRSADVVIANLPGETLKSMGLDWDSVSAANPRAILAVVSAFGLDGPYAKRVGFDGVAQAMCGRGPLRRHRGPAGARAPRLTSISAPRRSWRWAC